MIEPLKVTKKKNNTDETSKWLMKSSDGNLLLLTSFFITHYNHKIIPMVFRIARILLQSNYNYPKKTDFKPWNLTLLSRNIHLNRFVVKKKKKSLILIPCFFSPHCLIKIRAECYFEKSKLKILCAVHIFCVDIRLIPSMFNRNTQTIDCVVDCILFHISLKAPEIYRTTTITMSPQFILRLIVSSFVHSKDSNMSIGVSVNCFHL